MLAITGTNGKTTTTALTGRLVAHAGKTVAVAGNIGPGLLDTLAQHIDAGTLPEVWVLELSSFQLDGVQGFEPTAATVLNLTQDHLDWHGDMPAYGAAKARVFGSKGLLVLNRDDAAVMAMLPEPVRAQADIKHVDVLVISPTHPIEKIAERYAAELPWTIRLLLRLVGAVQQGGSTLVSYLLSENKYCRALIDLGYQDAMKRRDEILRFLDEPPPRGDEMPQ